MTKFKAGDKAVLTSVEPGWRVKVGDEVKIKGPFEGSAGPGYWVELCDKPGSCIYYGERRLGPVDDPLPPAPESVLYVNKWRWGVGVRSLGDEVQIGTGNPNSCNHGWTYATLDPDAALQLAHDLTRMAMEIKRRERAQSGE